MTAHAVGFHVDPVGAVEVLDHTGIRCGDHLAVMTADEAAVDLHVVVGGAPDNDPADTQGDFLHGAALGRHQQATERGAGLGSRGVRGAGGLGRLRLRLGARGIFDPLQLTHRADDVRARDRAAIRGVGGHHGGIAQGVDQPRYAAAVAKHLGKRIGGENLAVPGSGNLQPVLNVAVRFRLRQRLQVEPQPHALHELRELGRVELVVELGLSGENDPQHLVLGGLHTRQQADFLQHAHGEVLRFIDNQQHLAAGGVLFDQEVVDRADELGFAHLEGREAELHQHRLQEIDGRYLGLVDLRHHHVRRHFLEEGFDQRGLARADLACDHHEAVGEPDGRLHVRLGAGVLLRQVQELGVRAQPERQLLELEGFQIHACWLAADVTGCERRRPNP